MKRIQVVKMSAWLLAYLAVAGCQNSTDTLTILKTQSKSSIELVASEYSVSMKFKGEGATQTQATEHLAQSLLEFEKWVDSQSLNMKAGMASVSGVYQYRQNEKRKLTGYEARQDFIVNQMNFTDYQLLMSQGPNFTPDSMQLNGVVASQEDKDMARVTLIESAFKLAEQKAQTMAKAAKLCELNVTEMSENVQNYSRPGVMRATMDSEAIHKTESKQTMDLVLNVTWNAQQCN